METPQDKLLKFAINGLDTDVSPSDLAKDELGCAESVSNLIKKVFPDFPIILGTQLLFDTLRRDKRFKLTTTPQMGCIVISPTKGGIIGHTGVFITNDRIASNDSKTGQFKGNYTWDSWIAEMTHHRGLHTYLFLLV
jgi:hypothetical protein